MERKIRDKKQDDQLFIDLIALFKLKDRENCSNCGKNKTQDIKKQRIQRMSICDNSVRGNNFILLSSYLRDIPRTELVTGKIDYKI